MSYVFHAWKPDSETEGIKAFYKLIIGLRVIKDAVMAKFLWDYEVD
jgi:hypothetical protein